jgi:hypothetical protein
VFYVIAPVILCGIAACLWWIVDGALGVFGPGHAADNCPRLSRRQMRRPTRIQSWWC